MPEDATLFAAHVVQLTAHNERGPAVQFVAVIAPTPSAARVLVENIAGPGDTIVPTGGVLHKQTVTALGLVPEVPWIL